MSQDIENELRRAMRAIDPPPDFTARVMRALPARVMPATVTGIGVARPAARASLWTRLSAPVALAASLLVAIVLGQHVAMEQARREQLAGLEASRKLMQALRVTSQKLDIAYEAVLRPPPAAPPAEENRS
jgi:hypothetical protein